MHLGEMHTPNLIPISRRVGSSLGALGLAAYGAFGIWIDDLLIPGKRSSLHLSGLPAWIMGLALLCAAAHLASVVIDHYDTRDNEARYRLFLTWSRRLGWALAGLALALHIAGVRFPQPGQSGALGWVIGSLVFLVVAALGWVQPKSRASPDPAGPQGQTQATASWKVNTLQVVAAIFLILGCLLVLRDIIGLLKFGRVTQPLLATLGIAMTSFGAWLWLKARRLVLPAPLGGANAGGRDWLPLQVGAVLIVCVWGSQWMNFSPREGGGGGAQPASMPLAEVAERAAAPAFTLAPDDFRQQTLSGLTQMLRAAGHKVRCYGDLRRNEKLYPPITQICWTHARAAWGVPLENISFHFGGEVLEFVRLEFPHDQWPQVRQWFVTLPGEDAGTFGHDGDGNTIMGRRVGAGLMMTAPPSPRATILLLWESKNLLADRCRDGDRSFTPKQRSILCAG